MTDRPAAADEKARKPRLGLSGKLLILTILFVMIAAVLIYVPSVATFRRSWLNDRLSAAYTAALVLEAAPGVPDSIARQILDSIDAHAVAMKTGTQRRLLAAPDTPPTVDYDIDTRDMSLSREIIDAFGTLTRSHDAVLRVMGPAPMGGEFVEIVIDEAPLRSAMWQYSSNVLRSSMLVSGSAAMLVYLSLHLLFVRPLRRITANMMAFRGGPENSARIIEPSNREDEIGIAEHELAAMQSDLVSMLQQKNRLATLGLAVSKINHDLRNLLSSAQLFSDRLSSLPDPHVQRFAPKLMRTLERAIAFCQSTLSYGRAQEPPPDRRMTELKPCVEEVRESLGLEPDGSIRWISAVERSVEVDADPDQLFRVLLNLARNAVQALESRAERDPNRDQVRITGRREGAVVVIEVADTGPGVSEAARAHLFVAFQSSNRTGGSGLGLAIAAELVRAHGGEIRLVEGTIGATFSVTIPDRTVDLRARRGERARA